MVRRQRGQVARPTTGRCASSAVQAPQWPHLAASRPGRIGTPRPQRAQGTSGASTKRTASPQAAQAPRSPRTGTAAPQLGQGVVGAGTAGDRQGRP